MRMTKRAIQLRERELQRQAEEMPKRRFQSHFPAGGFTCPNCHTTYPDGAMAMQDELTGEDWCQLTDTCGEQKAGRAATTREERKAMASAFTSLLEASFG